MLIAPPPPASESRLTPGPVPRAAWLAVFAVSALMAAALVFRYQVYSSVSLGADAWSYEFYAFQMRRHGWHVDLGSIRTYGYPLFLAALSLLSGFDEARLALIAGTTQYLLLAAATAWLARCLRPRVGSGLAFGVFAGVLLNPWLLALVIDTMTESLTIVLFIVLIGVASRLDTRDGHAGALWLVGTSLAAFALMVRPANLVLVAAWALVGSVLVVRARSVLTLRALAVMLGTVVILAALWGPQVAYAWSSYGMATPMPVCRLGSLQVAYSIAAWKYDTLVGPAGAGAWFQANPLLHEQLPPDVGMSWYLRHPLVGGATLLAHVYNAFSVTSLSTYVWAPRPPYGLALRTASWLLLLLGAGASVSALGRVRWRSPPLPVIFTFAACAGGVALGAVTAVETRFNAIPIGVFTAFGVFALGKVARGQMLVSWPRRAALGAAVLLLVAIGWRLDRLGRADVTDLVPPVDLAAATCFQAGRASPAEWGEMLRDYGSFVHRASRP